MAARGPRFVDFRKAVKGWGARLGTIEKGDIYS